MTFVGGESILPLPSWMVCLSNSSANFCHNFCQSSIVKSLVCSIAGLTSIWITEFLMPGWLFAVSDISSQMPIASKSGERYWSHTWCIFSGSFLFLDSPLIYRSALMPCDIAFALPIMCFLLSLPCPLCVVESNRLSSRTASTL